MDLMGRGLHKGKPNLFAEIIERRKHEGDFHGIWRPAPRSETGPVSWARRGLVLLMLVIGAGIVFSLIISLWPGPRPEAPDMPRNPAVPGPAPKIPGTPPPPSKGLLAEESPSEASGLKTPGAPPPGEPKPGHPPPAGGEAAMGQEIVRADGKFVFRQMLPDFKPLEKLDLNFLEERTWDDTGRPEESNQIKKEPEAVEHIFRYLRTHGADLQALAQPRLTHSDMLREPESCRGKVANLRVLVVKKHMNLGWPKNDSGVQDTSMIFCYPADASGGQGAIYVVLVPQPAGDFAEGEIYNLTGVFWKRYPYVNSKNMWQWQPLILTMQMKAAPAPPHISQKVTVGIIIAAAVLIIGLLFLVRGETREGQEKRAGRIERRRRLQQQLARGPGNGGGAAPPSPARPLEPLPPSGRSGPDDPCAPKPGGS